MSDNTAPAPLSEQDAMAAEWAAALSESGQSSPAVAGTAHQDDAVPASFATFAPGSGAANAPGSDLNMILDIPVQLTVELGRKRLPIKHLLQLAQGSVVELEALAGEPMDVLVNGYLIAQGEVVVVNDRFRY